MKKCFTLIEVLVTSIITGIILSGVVWVIIISARIYKQGQIENIFQLNSQRVLQYVTHEIRYSENFNTGTTYSSDLILNESLPDEVIYAKNGNYMQRTVVGLGTEDLKIIGIDADILLEFREIVSNKIISVRITIENSDLKYIKTLDNIYLRN